MMNEAVCKLAQVCVCSPEASLFPPLIISQRATEMLFTNKNVQFTNWNDTYALLPSHQICLSKPNYSRVKTRKGGSNISDYNCFQLGGYSWLSWFYLG